MGRSRLGGLVRGGRRRGRHRRHRCRRRRCHRYRTPRGRWTRISARHRPLKTGLVLRRAVRVVLILTVLWGADGLTSREEVDVDRTARLATDV